MEKRWTRTGQVKAEKITQLASSLNIDKSLAEILLQRGIDSFERAKQFFRPSLSDLHDPFLMNGMEEAVNRISKAIQSNERILIYGDYDVDGTTAVALVYSFLKQFTEHIAYYIPDRHKEGYGISNQGIDYAFQERVTLIIALDCGIRSVDKIAYANTLGIDFIICDHHLPGDELPNAFAILDPKRIDCNYPFKELSGCGIGFKLSQGYCVRNQLPLDYCEHYLDLVMVSIAADIVPIVDENRILAHFGLIKLNENPNPGLKALMSIAGKTADYTITDVVFLLAPRINAAGRMDHGSQAVKMLLSDQEGALEQSLLINSQNTDRKSFDQQITADALAIIEQNPVYSQQKTTVVFHESWNKGVIGIVASRLIEKYYRPTIVLTLSNGSYTGSARSVAGYDLYEALLNCADLLDQFGGHKFAAGLTVKAENLIPFATKFEQVVAATINAEALIPEILIETELDLTQIDAKFYRILVQMAPFGPGNVNPIFVSHGVSLADRPQIVGANHLKLRVKQQNSAIFDTIAFGQADSETHVLNNSLFSICYSIEENIWKNKRTLQLNIKGIKIDNHLN